MRRIFRFLKSLWKYILYGKRVSFEMYCTRLSCCEYCPFMDKEKWTCTVCGCYVDKKTKMSTESCPRYRW